MPITRALLPTTERHWVQHLAAVLLFGLLIHLLFMASPAHAAMLESDTGVHARGMNGDVTSGMLPQALPLASLHASHCAVEWSVPDRLIISNQWLGAAPIIPTTPLFDVGTWRPKPLTVGPPQTADPQALLQVFRN
jgi:hypothetical protein